MASKMQVFFIYDVRNSIEELENNNLGNKFS